MNEIPYTFISDEKKNLNRHNLPLDSRISNATVDSRLFQGVNHY